MLRPDDTIQFYTSPYRRTRETAEGMMRTLTEGPSPFSKEKIRVWEEPRLREQDFGNFQPCGQAMERMWQERADYGHFFYRYVGLRTECFGFQSSHKACGADWRGN